MSSGFSGGSHGGGGMSGGSGEGSGHHSMGMVGDLQNSNMLGSELQAFSFSTLMDGLKVNSGVRFFALFASFLGWLYVIYWVRHHEPLVNQAIGVYSPQSSTTSDDRTLVAAVKNAFPFRTSGSMGALYVPSPKVPESDKHERAIFPIYGTAAPVQAGPGQAIAAPFSETNQGFDERFGNPGYQLFVNPASQGQIGNRSLVGDPLLSGYYRNISPPIARANTILPIDTTRPSYLVQVNSGTGKILQTVANR